jgi:replication factor A1
MDMPFKIAELRAGMSRVDVIATVLQLSEPRDVTTRRGEQMKVATARVKDDSGEINLTLWNEQIDQVKVGNTVKIENGYTTSFRGETQLNVGRYGKLTVE